MDTASSTRSPSNSLQDRVGGAADVVREDVEASAVRHPDDHVVGAVESGELDRLVEHRHHHVEALDGELLLAEERTTEVALEPFHFGQLLEKRLALVGRERLAVGPRLDRIAQPKTLLVARDVLDLVGERPAVGLAQLRKRLDQGLRRDVEAQESCRDPCLELGSQLRLEPVGVEGRISRRLGSERVDVRGEMAVRPVRLHEGHGGCHGTQKLVVHRRVGARLLDGGRRLGAVAVPVLGQPAKALGVRQALEDELGIGFEEGSPLRVDGVGRGEVIGQQLLDEAAVEVVYLVAVHSCPEDSGRQFQTVGFTK